MFIVYRPVSIYWSSLASRSTFGKCAHMEPQLMSLDRDKNSVRNLLVWWVMFVNFWLLMKIIVNDYIYLDWILDIFTTRVHVKQMYQQNLNPHLHFGGEEKEYWTTETQLLSVGIVSKYHESFWIFMNEWMMKMNNAI